MYERPKVVHSSPFLDPAFGDCKDIATKSGEARSRSQLVQTFTVADISTLEPILLENIIRAPSDFSF